MDIGQTGSYIFRLRAHGYETTYSEIFSLESQNQKSCSMTIPLQPKLYKCIFILHDVSRVHALELKGLEGQ